MLTHEGVNSLVSSSVHEPGLLTRPLVMIGFGWSTDYDFG